MLQILFGGMTGLSLLYGMARGRGEAVAAAMLAGAEDAVQAAFAMAGGFAFFCGMTAILRRAGAMERLGRLLSPLLSRLLGPGLPPDALEPVLLNLSANLLGLGNAATPMGVEACRRMAAADGASNALCLFLVINSSSVAPFSASSRTMRPTSLCQQPIRKFSGVSTFTISCRISSAKAAR